MKNKLYNLIQKTLAEDHKNLLIRNYHIKNSINSNNINYYMLTFVEKVSKPILIQSTFFYVEDYHISICEDLRESDKNAEFHITVNFVTKRVENEKELTKRIVARAFFDSYGNFIFLNLKDESQQVIQLEEFAIKDFCINATWSFRNITKTICEKQFEQYDKKFNDYLYKLTEKSKLLDAEVSLQEKISCYIDYKKDLNELISFINLIQIFNILESNTDSSIFEIYLTGIENKLRELENEKQLKNENNLTLTIENNSEVNIYKNQKNSDSQTKEEKNKKEEIQKKIEELHSSKIKNTYQAIIKEYEFQTELLKYTVNNNDFLTSITRIRELEKEARQTLTKIILFVNSYKNITKDELKKLISVAKLNSDFLTNVSFAIVNKQADILEVILEEVKNIDLNTKFKYKNTYEYPLNYAFQNNLLPIFKILLKYGANPELKNENGQTLLIQSCNERHTDMMISLLEANANPIVKDHFGATAIANILLNEARQSDIEMAEKFLKKTQYAYAVVNQKQGVLYDEGTPLAFACQYNMADVVTLLLKYNADPNLTRTDGISPLAVCVGKNNMVFFKNILKNSKIKVDKGLESALYVSEVFNKNEFKTFINKNYPTIKACITFSSSIPQFQLDYLIKKTDVQRIKNRSTMKAITEIINKFDLFSSTEKSKETKKLLEKIFKPNKETKIKYAQKEISNKHSLFSSKAKLEEEKIYEIKNELMQIINEYEVFSPETESKEIIEILNNMWRILNEIINNPVNLESKSQLNQKQGAGNETSANESEKSSLVFYLN
ncbi:MAG: hypothetical protein LEGION0398_MBIBDBAK_01267 [Legionellaceae bacterium]